MTPRSLGVFVQVRGCPTVLRWWQAFEPAGRLDRTQGSPVGRRVRATQGRQHGGTPPRAHTTHVAINAKIGNRLAAAIAHTSTAAAPPTRTTPTNELGCVKNFGEFLGLLIKQPVLLDGGR